MGGHGGLNILPQKRWHLYRDDNRQRVARDERRDREARDGRRRSANHRSFHEKVVFLRRRAAKAAATERRSGSREAADGSASGAESDASRRSPSLESDEGKRTAEAGKPAEKLSSKRKHEDVGVAEEESLIEKRRRNESVAIKSSSGGERKNCNFFAELEEASEKVREKHEAYLKEVGHTSVSISDFDFVGQKVKSAWYLERELPSALLYDEEFKKKEASVAPTKGALGRSYVARSDRQGRSHESQSLKESPTIHGEANSQEINSLGSSRPNKLCKQDRKACSRSPDKHDKKCRKELPRCSRGSTEDSCSSSEDASSDSGEHSESDSDSDSDSEEERSTRRERTRRRGSLESMDTSELLSRLKELEDRKKRRAKERRRSKKVVKRLKKRMKEKERAERKKAKLTELEELRKDRIRREAKEKARVASLCLRSRIPV